MNEKNFSDFPVYLQEKHYAHSTVCQYCSLLDRLDIDRSISDPPQLFEHINKSLNGFCHQVSKPVSRTAKATAGRYFEMITGEVFSAFEKGWILILLSQVFLMNFWNTPHVLRTSSLRLQKQNAVTFTLSSKDWI